MTQPRYAYIDALRGYAILGVMAVHTDETLHSDVHLPPILDGMATAGQYGVQLFFVVSALTLLMSWHKRKDGAAPFYIRRLFRIAPMFWLAACAYLITYGAPAGLSTPGILATFLFVHGWSPNTINTLVPGGWSIAAEVMFYVFFPFLAGAITTLSTAVIAFFAAVAIAILGGDIASLLLPTGEKYSGSNADFLRWWFIAQAPVFLVGFIVYHAMRFELPRWVWSLGIQGSILAMLFLVFAWWLPGSRQVLFALTFGLFALSLGKCGEDSMVNPVVEHIGRVSYSAYFWHFPILATYASIGHPLSMITASSLKQFVALYVVVVLISIILSTMTYLVIEKPMIRLGSRIASRYFLAFESHTVARQGASGQVP